MNYWRWHLICFFDNDIYRFIAAFRVKIGAGKFIKLEENLTMIPKIIHYIWLGGEKPQSVLDCISTWRKYCPDYEIKEWNENNCGLTNCEFLKETIELKKYGFASDPIRYKVLSDFGGIYLDTDVKLIKSFDSFLHLQSFIGKELPLRVGTAVIGAQAHTPWIEEFLHQYCIRGRHFINCHGYLDQTVSTQLLSEFINCTWHVHKNELSIFEEDYFCCKSFFTKQIVTTENSVAIHDFAYTWGNNPLDDFWWKRLRNLLIRLNLKLKR